MAVSDYSIFMDLRSLPYLLCQLQCAANYCLIIVSMVTLAFISMDRYIAVVWPLQYTNVVTRRRVLTTLCWPWLQGVLFAAAPVWQGWVHYDYWEAVCAINWEAGGRDVQYYVIIACILCFLVPAGIMLFCYVNIIRQARLCHRHIRPMDPATAISSNFKQAVKTITSLLVVVVVFFVCMTPFCLTKLLKVVISNDFIPGYVNLTSSYLEFLASLANPFIYGFFRREFRFAYYYIFWHLSCKASQFSPGVYQDSMTLQPSMPKVKITNYTMNQRKNGVRQEPKASTEDMMCSTPSISRHRSLSEPSRSPSPLILTFNNYKAKTPSLMVHNGRLPCINNGIMDAETAVEGSLNGCKFLAKKRGSQTTNYSFHTL